MTLVGVLASIPHDRLVPRPGAQGALEVVETTQSNPDFAYGAVASPDGRILAQATAPGVMLPAAAIPSEPNEWIGERELTS